jgi:cytochrome c
MRNLLIISVLSLFAFASTTFAYTTEQAEKGKEIFAKQCAECHGANGAGGTVPDEYTDYAGMKAPPVVGEVRLPSMKTAGNAYAFVKSHMPLQAPGSLSSDEALAVIAFDLMANGIEADGQPLTAENAKEINLQK